MASLLAITNRVLVRLREDPVTSLASDPYAYLVAAFVADIAREVNEAALWSALDHEVEVEVTPGETTYALPGTSCDSLLLYLPDGRPQAWVFEDPDAARYGEVMTQLDINELERRYQIDTQMTIKTPYHFSVGIADDNESLYLRVWPEPTSPNLIRIRFNTPEAELDPDTDEATEIVVPNRVVTLGALYLALNERGEEIGEPGNIAERRYLDALGAALESNIRNRERTGVLDWVRN